SILLRLGDVRPRVLHSFLHDALPISAWCRCSTGGAAPAVTGKSGRYRAYAARRPVCRYAAFAIAWPLPFPGVGQVGGLGLMDSEDRKSTRLNSSHVKISYAVFCVKKK